MADENVYQFPTQLQRLANEILDYLTRDGRNRDEWIEIQIGICTRLAEARGQFSADIEFGQWCETNGFGTKELNHQDRAAAIAMAGDPQALRACLEATTRRSLQLIHREEFPRFTNASKPSSRRKQRHIPLNRPSPEFEKAKDAYDTLAAKGEPFTVQDIANAAGVSDTPVRRVLAYKEAESLFEPLTLGEMNKTTLRRYELAVKKARAEIREELKAEVYAELDVFVRHVKEKSDRADRILATYKGMMSRETFRKIRACLHPDHNTFKFAAEALQAFSELEAVLVKPDDPVYDGPALPTTAAELMQRRRRR